MNDKVKIWTIIRVSLVLCTLIISCMIVIVSTNPFEFSFIADDNAVQITDNLMKSNEKVNQAEIDKTICETKLSLLDSEVCSSVTHRSETNVYEETHDFKNGKYDCVYKDSKLFNCRINVIDWGNGEYTYEIHTN